jgi:type IV secretory pathway TrbF-like protein
MADESWVIGTHPLDGATVEYDLLIRAERNGAAWRRAFWAALLLAVFGLLYGLYALSRVHPEAIVYHEDRSGDIALMGRALDNQTPALPSVKRQLGEYIAAWRTIPGDDSDLAQQNAALVAAMTVRGSASFQHYADFVDPKKKKQNPLDLGKRGFRRTVAQPVEVNKLTDLTYRIAWKEQLRQGDGDARVESYFGTVTLAQPPRAPSDPLMGALNPAGIFVVNDDLPMSLIE